MVLPLEERRMMEITGFFFFSSGAVLCGNFIYFMSDRALHNI